MDGADFEIIKNRLGIAVVLDEENGSIKSVAEKAEETEEDKIDDYTFDDTENMDKYQFPIWDHYTSTHWGIGGLLKAATSFFN